MITMIFLSIIKPILITTACMSPGYVSGVFTELIHHTPAQLHAYLGYINFHWGVRHHEHIGFSTKELLEYAGVNLKTNPLHDERLGIIDKILKEHLEMYRHPVMEKVHKSFNLDMTKHTDPYTESSECRRYLGDRVYQSTMDDWVEHIVPHIVEHAPEFIKTGDEEIQDKLIRNIRKEIGESYNNLTRELREEDINPNNTKKLVDVFDDIPELKEVRPNYDYNIDAVKHTRVLTCVAGALVVFGACSQLM